MQIKAPRRRLPFILLVIALFVPLAARAGDKSPEPDGFGKAKFGMSESQVKALYPKAQEIVQPTPPPGKELPFALTSYTLENQSIGPLKKCKVTLKFFQHELTEVMHVCQEDPDKVYDYLEKRFGTPQTVSGRNAVSWTGKTASVTEMRAAGTFMFSDLERSRKMSMLLLAYTVKMGQSIFGAPQTPAAPAATPEAAK